MSTSQAKLINAIFVDYRPTFHVKVAIVLVLYCTVPIQRYNLTKYYRFIFNYRCSSAVAFAAWKG